MKVISVGQLNRYVKNMLERDDNLAAVYIGGEISNFTHHYKSCPTQRPHGLQPTRLLGPWDFSGKSTASVPKKVKRESKM